MRRYTNIFYINNLAVNLIGYNIVYMKNLRQKCHLRGLKFELLQLLLVKLHPSMQFLLALPSI